MDMDRKLFEGNAYKIMIAEGTPMMPPTNPKKIGVGVEASL
jgi:hypothetical protein